MICYFHSQFIDRLNRIIEVCKISSPILLLHVANSNLPSSRWFMPCNPRHAAYVINAIAHVHHVLLMGYNTQISSLIIQPISVNMIYHKSGRGSENNVLHWKDIPMSILVNIMFGIKCMTRFYGVPSIFTNSLIVSIINQCYLSLRQRYFFHGILNKKPAHSSGQTRTSGLIDRVIANLWPGHYDYYTTTEAV